MSRILVHKPRDQKWPIKRKTRLNTCALRRPVVDTRLFSVADEKDSERSIPLKKYCLEKDAKDLFKKNSRSNPS